MILITSAAYVEREFQIEFGTLPPSFLPIENLRLFELQIKLLKKHFPNEEIVLSIPNDFIINFRDLNILKNHNVRISSNKVGLSLGESILSSLENIFDTHAPIRILHGDTLFDAIDLNDNCISVGEVNDGHDWEIDNNNDSKNLIWSGYFSFNAPNDFLDAIKKSKGDFVSAVRLYDLKNSLDRLCLSEWYDFGHISTYFQSRSKLTTERAFNSLFIKDGSLVKTGSPLNKIKGEYQWFKNIIPELLIYTPMLTYNEFGGKFPKSYMIEYLPLPPLNEVYVHGSNGVNFWKNIFNLVDDFLHKCSSYHVPEKLNKQLKKSLDFLVIEKTKNRLNEFYKKNMTLNANSKNIFNNEELPSVKEITERCIKLTLKGDYFLGVSHGDLCLSNILFDSRTQRIKVVDPRGIDYLGKDSIFGDVRYDLAKFSHSIIGLYDHIIAGSFELDYKADNESSVFNFIVHTSSEIDEIQDMFKETIFVNAFSYKTVLPLTILLFFSMLPLHYDKPRRQLAFYANALRLYKILIEEKIT